MKKNKGNKNKVNISEEYKNSWNYIKSSKKIIYFVVGLFVLFFLIGLFAPTPETVATRIQDFMQGILEKTEGMSQGQLIWFIFSNNLQSSFFGAVLGVLAGVFPVLSTISNGYIVGFVSKMSIESAGVLSLWRLLPHGIFELPAVFLSFSIGIRFGLSLFNKKKWGKIKENLISGAKTFLLIVIPLLIIAAIIEGTLISLGP